MYKLNIYDAGEDFEVLADKYNIKGEMVFVYREIPEDDSAGVVKMEDLRLVEVHRFTSLRIAPSNTPASDS